MLYVNYVYLLTFCVLYFGCAVQDTLCGRTSRSAVAKRPRYASYLLVVSFNRQYLERSFLWTPTQRSLSEVHYILLMFFKFIFYDRLILRPRLTEVRETFTRGGP